MGAFVASTIWPIVAGLYWQRSNAMGAGLAMLSGTVIGIICYFQIGFYVAAVVSAAVSMTVVIATTAYKPNDFDWNLLAQPQKEVI
jgi:Na+/pantothenate symporter